MTRGAAFFAALLVSIGRPAWWLMALATFLLRGGIVVVLLPIVTVPSPLAISNAFAPILLPLALGRIEPAIVAGPVVAVAALLIWLVGGGRIAAGIDVAFVRDAAAAALEEGVAGRVGGEVGSDPDGALVPPSRRSTSGLAWRVLAVRLIAWLPLALAVGFGLAAIVGVTYVELTRPVNVSTPLVVRVARAVVSQLALIVIAWVVGEVVGGVATRRVVLGRGRYGRSMASAVRYDREPAAVVARPVAGDDGGPCDRHGRDAVGSRDAPGPARSTPSPTVRPSRSSPSHAPDLRRAVARGDVPRRRRPRGPERLPDVRARPPERGRRRGFDRARDRHRATRGRDVRGTRQPPTGGLVGGRRRWQPVGPRSQNGCLLRG